MKKLKLILPALLLAASCNAPVSPSSSTGTVPETYPDYRDVTIPCNIAPLNFRLAESEAPADEYAVRIDAEGVSSEFRFRRNEFRFPIGKWRALLGEKSQTISLRVMRRDGREWKAYESFPIHVLAEKIDPYVVYRLIDPGYEAWNRIGIYQRCLETFRQSPIITNSRTDKNCMNCHSFSNRDPRKMLFHMRGTNGGTYIVGKDCIEKLNTKTDRTISALVYPQWSPDGSLVAFSVNDTWQAFHSTNPNRIEVFDTRSDVVIYDVEKRELFSDPRLMSEGRFETFPTFSPDMKRLYFCSSPAIEGLPDNFEQVKYSICAVDFDASSHSFGEKVDTLYNARTDGGSASFPRISPDGRFLLFTRAGYGNFSIWHKDADLWMTDLTDGSVRSLDSANSGDVDSYHSWSSGGHWVIFSSRREDGLFTRLYITHIDEEGRDTKAFVLPQEDTRFNHRFMQSFNIPELVTGPVDFRESEIVDVARNSPGTDITFAE